jgi:hypothetical protein
VRDQVRKENINIRLFRSDDCDAFEIDRNEDDQQYIDVDIVPDLNPGDGTGTREVRDSVECASFGWNYYFCMLLTHFTHLPTFSNCTILIPYPT